MSCPGHLKTSQTFTKTFYSLLYKKNGKTRIANTFHHRCYSENIKDGSRLGRGVGGRVTGGLVLHHVLHGGGHHRGVDEREVGSDPDLIELLDCLLNLIV